MSRFQNATGYLLELRQTENKNWFNALCDMALQSGGAVPTQIQLNDLWDYFFDLKAYVPVAALPALVGKSGTYPVPVFLEEISEFSGFKKLSPGLKVQLEKQVTLIFGRNGSGKSSLCQALKVLANPEKPREPLHNARATVRTMPSFSYRFRTNAAKHLWTEPSGFGIQAQSIKYFDSTIALKHSTGSLKPEESVEISVFRLEVFDYAGQFVAAFRTYAWERISTELEKLRRAMSEVKVKLATVVNVNVPPMQGWTPETPNELLVWLASFPVFDENQEAQLAAAIVSLMQHRAATSDEGLKALRMRAALLGKLKQSLSDLQQVCQSISIGDLQSIHNQLIAKQLAVNELARSTFNAQIPAEHNHELILAASLATDFSQVVAHQSHCPLCQQELDEQAVHLFQQYHRHLTSSLQHEIDTLSGMLKVGQSNLDWLRSYSLEDFSSCSDSFPSGFFETLYPLIDSIHAALPLKENGVMGVPPDALEGAKQLHWYLEKAIPTFEITEAAIRSGTDNRESVMAGLKKTEELIANLNAAKAMSASRVELTELSKYAQLHLPFLTRYNATDFATMLRGMTLKRKEAHSSLVLQTFEGMLDKEYVALSGRTLLQAGVRLATKGSQQDVSVTAQIGDEPIYRILSEGEQKIHALAVFMCEASTGAHQILVFDDPVTSFDYNYVSEFCSRIRDFMIQHPERQLIVLTHSWDFFINLQSTIARATELNGKLSIQVLEDCATVVEFSEDWDVLVKQIEGILHLQDEPTSSQKELLSGYMRRLIERLTNRHVFNEQRQQYKNKAQKVSNFHDYCKIVPLLNDEANKLRDLFAALSPPEHDDARNYYVAKSKAQFATWFADILRIRDDLKARRP